MLSLTASVLTKRKCQDMLALSTKQSPRSDSAEAPTALGSIAKLLSTLGYRYCGITDHC